MTMAGGTVTTKNPITVYKPITTVNLATLKTAVAAMEPGHPIRAVVGTLPTVMPIADYLGILPSLWALSERP